MTVIWSIHNLSGIATPANAAYSISELTHQLKSSGAKALFTCAPLLRVALAAAKQAVIPFKHVYLLQLPSVAGGHTSTPGNFKTVDQLIAEGEGLSPVRRVAWEKGRGAKQVALLSYSSGTSGPPVSATRA
jgi:long-subunit acyl-CoA synthetase (AMP-forming)